MKERVYIVDTTQFGMVSPLEKTGKTKGGMDILKRGDPTLSLIRHEGQVISLDDWNELVRRVEALSK